MAGGSLPACVPLPGLTLGRDAHEGEPPAVEHALAERSSLPELARDLFTLLLPDHLPRLPKAE